LRKPKTPKKATCVDLWFWFYNGDYSFPFRDTATNLPKKQKTLKLCKNTEKTKQTKNELF